MKIDINLANITNDGNSDQRLNKLRKISYTALIIVALFSVAIFLINLRFSVNYVKNQQQKLTKELSIYGETASRLFLLNSRLTDIASILEKRKEYNKIADQIIEDMSGSITIRNFQLSETGVVIIASAPSLKDLNDFTNQMIKLSKEGVVSNVVLEALSTEQAEYVVTLKTSL